MSFSQPRSTAVPKLLSIGFLALLGWASVACKAKESVPVVDQATVMQTIRDYGRDHHGTRTDFSVAAKTPSTELDAYSLYEAKVSEMFQKDEFDKLEKEVRQLRIGKDRVQGEGWKINVFYASFAQPVSEKLEESDWKEFIGKFKTWMAKYPDSPTPRIGLADAYLAWASDARGDGMADTVTSSGWDLFRLRARLAKNALLEAAKLKEKCPVWYSTMQAVAKAEGWSKPDARELLNQAAAFEPSFYYFYIQQVEYLLPKWYGDPGDVQLFANEVTANIPEPEGSMMYFELACDQASFSNGYDGFLNGWDWPRIKQGYANVERIYGTSIPKNNRFAFLAYIESDRATEAQMFALIGDSPDLSVWHDQQSYQAAKAYFLAQAQAQ